MIISNAKKVFDIEIEELHKVKDKLDESFVEIIGLLKNLEGKVVVLGIGKSGIIGKKIAASMSSTGTHTVFINAAEGLHGDLGVINRNDVCILISNSGSSEEVINLIPTLKVLGNKLIGVTGNLSSPLAKACDYNLDIGVAKEACPLQLAPTSSTTATLVMGDAISISLMQEKGFKPNNFALYHPGGALGRKLLTKVRDRMVKSELLTFVDENNTLLDLLTNHRMRYGIAFVCKSDSREIVGILTDGDIRRSIRKYSKEVFDISLKNLMNENYCKIENLDVKLIDILPMFEQNKISSCPVFEEGKIKGLIELKEIYSII